MLFVFRELVWLTAIGSRLRILLNVWKGVVGIVVSDAVPGGIAPDPKDRVMKIVKLISTRFAARGTAPDTAPEADRLGREEVQALLVRELLAIRPLAA